MSNKSIASSALQAGDEDVFFRDASRYIRGVGFIYDDDPDAGANHATPIMINRSELRHQPDQQLDIPQPTRKPGAKKTHAALRMTASNRTIRKRKPSGRKKSASNKTSQKELYVPLAFCQKRSDEYYWF